MSLGVESFASASYGVSPALLFPFQGMSHSTSLSSAQVLAKSGYTPDEFKNLNAITSLETKKIRLKENLKSTVLHVFEDSVVSYKNSYRLENGAVLSHPDGAPLNIDPDERGGFYEAGITSAIEGAVKEPGSVVLLYSPPGPVVFDTNPNNKFALFKPYEDGQLYMMYSPDGKTVDNMAISISGEEGDKWIQSIMPDVHKGASAKPNAIAKVAHYITSPYLTHKSVDDFLSHEASQSDHVIFTNKDGISFLLSQTLSLIHQSLAGELTHSSIVDELIENFNFDTTSAFDIHTIYHALAQKYMVEKGVNSMTLGGNCGGETTTLDPLSSSLPNLSSSLRQITQGSNILKLSKDPKEDKNLCQCGMVSVAHFHCPGVNKKTKEPCKHLIIVGEGTTSCPECGQGKTC